MEEMQQRVTDNPGKVKSRKSIVEHPFGTVKRWMDQGYFLTRGLEKVRGDMSLTVLAYNLKRVISIIGVKDLLAVVSEKGSNVSDPGAVIVTPTPLGNVSGCYSRFGRWSLPAKGRFCSHARYDRSQINAAQP
jgi:Transposase DDE domain